MTSTITHPPTFHRWLRRLRVQHDLTQEALAELAFCSVQTIRFFEGGKRRPSVAMAERLAAVLHVPAEQKATFLRLARLPLIIEAEESAPAPVVTPPSLTAAVTPLPLPGATATIIGRTAEINVLRTLLLPDPSAGDGNRRARLVTVVGAGGMGKTQLALACARQVREHFADGVGFVALAALDDGHLLPVAVANLLNLALQGARDPADQVLAALAPRQMLLILDNFEHLLANQVALTWVNRLLETAPHLQLLVTSRERLRIGQERIFALDGLSLVQEAQKPADAVLLFAERAQAARSDFALDEDNAHAVAQICQLLAGMPLGIELAATWTRILSCAEIVEELQRGLDFLALADRDMPSRHRSMRVVFDHSWALLNEPERQLLAGLSIFRGGCSWAAAQGVAAATLPTLAALIDKSLLRRTSGVAGQTRYELHELLRQYAGERLAADPPLQQRVQERLILYFATFVREGAQHLAGAQQMAALAQLEQDLDNIRTAWTLACEQGQSAALLQMLGGLGDAFYWWSRRQEAVALYGVAIAALDHALATASADSAANLALRAARCACRIWLIGDEVGGSAAAFDTLHGELDELATAGVDVRAWRAHLLHEQAYFQAAFLGDFGLAQDLQTRCVALYRQLSDPHHLVRALVLYARLALHSGQIQASIEISREAIALATAQGDQLATAGAMEGLALCFTDSGRFAEAEPLFQAALAATAQTHRSGKMADILMNQATLSIALGRFDQCRTQCQQAVAIGHAIGDPYQTIHAALLIALAAMHLGEYEAALAIAYAEQLTAQRFGVRREEAMADTFLASVQLGMGQPQVALRSLERAARVFRTTTHEDLGWLLTIQAFALRALGQVDDLRATLHEAIGEVQQAHSFVTTYSLLPLLALVCFDQGESEAALACVRLIQQSAYLQHSQWFADIALIEVAQQIATLPPSIQQSLHELHPVDNPPPADALFIQIRALL